MSTRKPSFWKDNVEAIFKYAIEQNDAGNTFPIFGTCLGMQLLATFTSSENYNIHSRLKLSDKNQTNPLIFTDEKSDFYELFSPDQKRKVTTGTGILYFNHKYGMTP